MADRPQPAQVPAAVAGGPAARHQQGRVPVLEPAARLDQHVQEEVPLVGEEAPGPVLLAHDALDVGGRRGTVPDPAFADVDESMGSALHRERVRRRVAGEDRRIDQRVEVRRAIAVRPAVRRRGEGGHALAPARRQLDADVVGARRGVGRGQERRSAVEHREVRLDPVRADAHLPAVDPVGHRDPVGAAGLDAPAVLARLGDCEGLSRRRGGAHRLDVPGILADQIGAGCPRRHHQLDIRPSVRRHRRFHLGVVGGRCGEADCVRDGIERLSGQDARVGREHCGGQDHALDGVPVGACQPILLSTEPLYHRRTGCPSLPLQGRTWTWRKATAHQWIGADTRSRAATAAPSRAGFAARMTRTGMDFMSPSMGPLARNASRNTGDARAGRMRGAMPPPM